MRAIDADALKKAVIHHLGIRSEKYLLESERSIYNLIDEQPTVEQPKWIPVIERLPKKEDIPYDCLVTLEHGVVCEATFLDMDAPYHKWCANTGWLYHVTHWMPMPKPPKDGEHA